MIDWKAIFFDNCCHRSVPFICFYREQAFLIRFVLEPRRPAADFVEAPSAFPGKIEHEHHREVLQLQPVEISRAANKVCAKSSFTRQTLVPLQDYLEITFLILRASVMSRWPLRLELAYGVHTP
jgi:hypothetical protein